MVFPRSTEFPLSYLEIPWDAPETQSDIYEIPLKHLRTRPWDKLWYPLNIPSLWNPIKLLDMPRKPPGGIWDPLKRPSDTLSTHLKWPSTETENPLPHSKSLRNFLESPLESLETPPPLVMGVFQETNENFMETLLEPSETSWYPFETHEKASLRPSIALSEDSLEKFPEEL